MPILWKYLLKSYFQFFILCLSAFVAVLLVIRFQEIALFASSGAGIKHIALFSLYQIPYILPLAIPISCLISALILFQRMSTSLELTALRASGIGILPIAYPLLVAAFALSLVNFSITSEVTPVSRALAKNLIYEIVTENPLIVMQKDSMLNLKTVDFDLKKLKVGKKAEEVVCIMKQTSSDRIGIFTAKEISIDSDSVLGKSISILSSADSNINGYDHLIIENQKTMQTSKEQIVTHLLKTDWFAKDDLLKLKDIIAKYRSETGVFLSKPLIEILRRACLGLCPLTFTLIGIAFGTNIGRQKRKSAIFSAFFLSSLIMICFIASKTIQKSALIAFFLYILPQPIAALASLRSLSLSSKGVE